MYLSDPFYPTDFLYARQIVELLPLLVSDRPGTAIAIAVARRRRPRCWSSLAFCSGGGARRG